MNAQKFDDIVEARAQERVKAKVATFKRKVFTAFDELHGSLTFSHGGGHQDTFRRKDAVKAIFRDLLGEAPTAEAPSGYPPELWKDERDDVRKTLLSTLDEMAKALIAPKPTDVPPIAEITEK